MLKLDGFDRPLEQLGSMIYRPSRIIIRHSMCTRTITTSEYWENFDCDLLSNSFPTLILYVGRDGPAKFYSNSRSFRSAIWTWDGLPMAKIWLTSASLFSDDALLLPLWWPPWLPCNAMQNCKINCILLDRWGLRWGASRMNDPNKARKFWLSMHTLLGFPTHRSSWERYSPWIFSLTLTTFRMKFLCHRGDVFTY